MMGQMGVVPPYVIAMTVIGVAMSAIFMHIVFAPFARLKRAVAAEDWKAGGAALNQIRILWRMGSDWSISRWGWPTSRSAIPARESLVDVGWVVTDPRPQLGKCGMPGCLPSGSCVRATFISIPSSA